MIQNINHKNITDPIHRIITVICKIITRNKLAFFSAKILHFSSSSAIICSDKTDLGLSSLYENELRIIYEDSGQLKYL